jgi:crotonobetainyl-CoA:carnitine CoA-transferase CaiB-like acyl-CoA transferase
MSAPEGGAPGSDGPVAGVRVVDLTTARSGPTCVRQLVDLGADAIHVAAASGRGELGGSDGWNLRRGSRSVELDIREPAGYDALLRLIDRADILVENFRPAVKYRLGLAPDDMLARNPRLIYASISGFGEDGPYADRPGLDQIAQGLSGLMTVTGPPGSGPWRTGVAISDTAAGTFLTQGVLAALYAREKTGRGQWVRTSLLESVVNFMDFQAVRYLNEGEVPQQAGNDHPTLVPMGAYRTSDGMVNIAVMSGFDRFCAAVDAPELLTDPRFSDLRSRTVHRNALAAEVARLLLRNTTDHWVAVLNAADLPCGPVLTVDEMFADPQIRHLDLTAGVPHPTLPRETVQVLRHPVTLSATPTAVRGGPPARGTHTHEVLAELGYSEAEIALITAARR